MKELQRVKVCSISYSAWIVDIHFYQPWALCEVKIVTGLTNTNLGIEKVRCYFDHAILPGNMIDLSFPNDKNRFMNTWVSIIYMFSSDVTII